MNHWIIEDRFLTGSIYFSASPRPNWLRGRPFLLQIETSDYLGRFHSFHRPRRPL